MCCQPLIRPGQTNPDEREEGKYHSFCLQAHLDIMNLTFLRLVKVTDLNTTLHPLLLKKYIPLDFG